MRPFHGDDVAGRIELEGATMATTFEDALPIRAHVVVIHASRAAAIAGVRS